MERISFWSVITAFGKCVSFPTPVSNTVDYIVNFLCSLRHRALPYFHRQQPTFYTRWHVYQAEWLYWYHFLLQMWPLCLSTLHAVSGKECRTTAQIQTSNSIAGPSCALYLFLLWISRRGSQACFSVWLSHSVAIITATLQHDCTILEQSSPRPG